MTRDVVVRPRGTAWGAVLGGWLAALGVAALLSPLVAAVLGSLYLHERSLAAAVPGLLGVGRACLTGGHMARRAAGSSPARDVPPRTDPGSCLLTGVGASLTTFPSTAFPSPRKTSPSWSEGTATTTRSASFTASAFELAA